jgi:hypothetical protein
MITALTRGVKEKSLRQRMKRKDWIFMKKINNLSELKKFLQIGSEFKVLKHQKPKLVGQLRKVTKVQTNAVYTIIPNEPEHENSKCNGGKGLRMDFDKANHYEFGDTIKWFNKPVGTKDNHLIMEFEVL